MSPENFIRTPGYVINPDRIDFVKIQKDGSVIVNVGPNSIHVDGDDGIALRKVFVPDTKASLKAEAAAAASLAASAAPVKE